MKHIVLLLSVTLLLASCGGNSKSNQKEALDNVKWQDNDICAMIFLGYCNDFSTLTLSDDFKKYSEDFPSLQKMTKFTIETEGDEVYYIIPRYGDATISVREYGFDFENMKEIIGKELYNGGNQSILIKCNISDIHPNTNITITGNGGGATFNPTSGIGGNELLHIANALENREDISAANLQSRYEYSGVYAGITASVISGKVFLYFDINEATYILGNDDANLMDRFEVELVDGAAKLVYIADYGQDYNPILYCILENGGVEVLPLYSALRNSDFSTSGRLPGFENIVSIANESVEDESGMTYAAPMATDAKGNKKEIEFCHWLEDTWIHQAETENGVMCYVLEFTSDWKISFKSGFINSEAHEFYIGKFWLEEEQSNGNGYSSLYKYQMKEADRSEMTGETPDPTVRKGSFQLQAPEYWSEYLELKYISGLRFLPEDEGVMIRVKR